MHSDSPHPAVRRMRSAFHYTKLKSISIKHHAAIMEYLVDPSLPKEDVLIISTSIGTPDRTAYARLYTQPRLLDYAKMHGYGIRIYTEPANIKCRIRAPY